MKLNTYTYFQPNCRFYRSIFKTMFLLCITMSKNLAVNSFINRIISSLTNAFHSSIPLILGKNGNHLRIYLSGSKLNVVMEALYAVLLEVKKMWYQKNMTERYLCMSALQMQPQNRFSPMLMYLLLAIYIVDGTAHHEKSFYETEGLRTHEAIQRKQSNPSELAKL